MMSGAVLVSCGAAALMAAALAAGTLLVTRYLFLYD